jgi:uncharacterized protein (TIGR02594 family)
MGALIRLLFDELIDLINAYYKSKKSPVPQKQLDERVIMFRNKAVLLQAASQIGVKEVPGEKSNPKIMEYHKYSTIKNAFGFSDSVPWCASFVAWCLEKVGMQSTNKQLARSYEKWGMSVKAAPLPGDIVTFWRTSPKSGYGHVGFFLKKTPKGIYILGGNQNDSVNITLFPTAKLTDIRRSSKAGVYSDEQINELHFLANQILAGEVIAQVGTLT